MSQEKLARRKKMGDDPTAMTQSNATTAGAPPAQPLPDMPQSGKAGNMMNNPMNGTVNGWWYAISQDPCQGHESFFHMEMVGIEL